MIQKLNWINPKISVGLDELYGRCQIAGEDIKQNEVLVVFGGHVLTVEEFHLLDSELQTLPYQIGEDPDLFFGPTSFAEIQTGEFFNHSCSPNSGFKSAIQLVAKSNIKKDEQIMFDYSTCMTIDGWKLECFCRSEECRRIITGNDWKIKELQAKYRGFFQPYIEDKISRMLEKSATGDQ